MRLITPSQCRAGRGLLNWSQPKLAQLCSMHKQTISNFEAERSTPSKRSLEKLMQTLQNAGIEFLDDNGVRQKTVFETFYYGQDGIRSLFDSMYESFKNEGGNVCQFHLGSGKFLEWLGEEWFEHHKERMLDIADQLQYRIIVNEGAKIFISSEFAEYRVFPRHKMSKRTVHVFADKVCFFYPDTEPLKIKVIHDKDMALTMREFFNLAWSQAKIPADL